MEDTRLGAIESHFADLIWQHAPLPSGELVKLCERELNWKKSTTYTVLRKLCQRGFLENKDAVVTALVPKEQVQVYQSEHFVDRVFDGSLPQFLASFLGGRALTEQEAQEIKELIDRYSGQ